MKWTNELPTVPGVYWFKSDRHPLTICEVIEFIHPYTDERKLQAKFPGEEDWDDLTGYGSEAKWYGPIEPPKDD